MRLLKSSGDGGFSLETFRTDTPPYAILSHTWGDESDEVTFKDIESGGGRSKRGYQKLLFCDSEAQVDGLRYFWIDTCCIDKSSQAELSRSINSMFRWYRDAARCYVYLTDVAMRSQDGQANVDWKSAFRNSRWFTRGWTLQELLAPPVVEFYSADRVLLGDRRSLEQHIHEATGISLDALRGKPLKNFIISERFKWVDKRQTTEEEDIAYSLLGIFDVFLPLIYGEGRTNAIRRLQREIDELEKTSREYDRQNDLSSGSRNDQILPVQDAGDFMKWIVTTDPSPKHNASIELHEPHTGNWLLRSPEYAEWLTGSTKLFWVHGIPGAGKTVLLSFIAQRVQEHCRQKAPRCAGFCYYYCDFTRNQDETSHLLRWVIGQLCRQSGFVPKDAMQLYRAGVEPSNRSLVSVLSVLFRLFDAVFLVVDALDETRDQTRLVSTLLSLTAVEFPNVKILATSRREPDIERLLCQVPHMSLSNPLVDEDIRLHINETFSRDHQFVHWRASLSSDVKNALVSGAQGMFRWVACQLDTLGKLNTESEVRNALQDLPKDLDETYTRILVNIGESNRPYALRALNWLLVPMETKRLTTDVLAVAVTMPCQGGKFRLEEQLFDPSRLHDIFGCLITVVKGRRGDYFRLAHYTVKEFLLSDRIKLENGPASCFYMDEFSAEILVTRTLLKSLLDLDAVFLEQFRCYDAYSARSYSARNDSDEQDALSRYSAYAVAFWKLYASRILHADYADWIDEDSQNSEVVQDVQRLHEINDLVLELFDRFHDGSAIFCNNCGYEERVVSIEERSDQSDNIKLAYLCKFHLIKSAKVWLTNHPNVMANRGPLRELEYWLYDDSFVATREGEIVTTFETSARQEDGKFLRLFIQEGRVDYSARSHENLCPLGVVLSYRDDPCDTIDLLSRMIQKGADIRPTKVSSTLLEIAILKFRGKLDIIKYLLESGVDVDAIGDMEASWRLYKRLEEPRTYFIDSWSPPKHTSFSTPLGMVVTGGILHQCSPEMAGQLGPLQELLKSYGATLNGAESQETARAPRSLEDIMKTSVKRFPSEDETGRTSLGESSAVDLPDKRRKLVHEIPQGSV